MRTRQPKLKIEASVGVEIDVNCALLCANSKFIHTKINELNYIVAKLIVL